MAGKSRSKGASGGRRGPSIVTIRAVAERARVSIATVSHVMNQTRYVRPETRNRVIKVAGELGYAMTPNSKAQRRGPAGAIGLLLAPDLSTFDSPIMLGGVVLHFVTIANEERYTVLAEPMRRQRTNGLATPRLIAEQRVGGVLIVGAVQEQDFEQIRRWATPVCLLGDNGVAAAGIPTVKLNHQAGMRDAVQYLAALGHKRVGLVLTASEALASAQKKHGYLETVEEFSLDRDPKLIVELPADQQDFAGGRGATARLLQAACPPTAICYASDWVALGGLRAADEHGLRVPQQLSIVGYNDSILSRQSDPALTTVQIDPAATSHAAINILRRQIQNRSSDEQVLEIRPRLVRRDSCAAVSAS